MKADPMALRWLLDLQAADSRLDQLAHLARTMPQLKELEEIAARLATSEIVVVNAQTARDDCQRELTRAEADVDLVRTRAARDQQRLESGTGSAKELQSLQSELASLARRQATLEETQLEIMERCEALGGEVEKAQSARDELAQRLQAVEGDKTLALEGITTQASKVEVQRAAIIPQLPDELVALYDKIRASSGGVGVAPLVARRCEGCRLELNQVEIGRIKAAPADEVLRCEECRRILVRTAESGL